MICRLWRGWTSPENADEYERIVRGEVIPAIEARNIPGFRHVDLMKRDLGGEIEFQTLMWFDSLDAIKTFMAEDYTVSHVPLEARAVLNSFDDRAAHFEVIDRRAKDLRSAVKHLRCDTDGRRGDVVDIAQQLSDIDVLGSQTGPQHVV